MYTPRPEHKFTFGLWTVGSTGRDPFGGSVRNPKSPAELVRLLGEVGAYGVNFHDNDLIPIDATPAEALAIKKEFRKVLDETGLVVPMATTNLFSDPVFKDGAFTANDPKVRAYALQKTMNANVAMLSAVSASAGDDRGLVRKPIVLVTAVAPKLVPSDQASRWTLNQTPDSPAVRSTYHWKKTNPTGASTTEINDHHCRRCRIAMKLATAHAATTAMPLGRVAVASAAASPRHARCLMVPP